MSSRRWPTLAAAVASGALGLTLLVAPPGSGASAPDVWGPAHRFERDPIGASMAQDRRGVTTVVWGSQRGWPEPVKAAQRTPAGRWRAPVTLGVGYSPVVTADGAGNLLAAWTRDEAGRSTGVWAARKPVGQPWSSPVRLSDDVAVPGDPDSPDVLGAQNLDVALRADGSALVVWEWGSWDRDVIWRVQAAYRPPGQAWLPAQTLTATRDAHDARASLGPRGRAWVAYAQDAQRGPNRIIVRSRAPRGAWSAPTRLGGGSMGDLSATGRGDVVVVLCEAGAVKSVVKPAGRRWRPAVTATPRGCTCGAGRWP